MLWTSTVISTVDSSDINTRICLESSIDTPNAFNVMFTVIRVIDKSWIIGDVYKRGVSEIAYRVNEYAHVVRVDGNSNVAIFGDGGAVNG
jgi:hypothetical protein